MEIDQNVATIKLGKSYDMEKLGEIIDFSHSKDFHSVKYIIVDGGELTFINVMGGEVFFLRDSDQVSNPIVLFCAFSDEMKFILKQLSNNMIDVLHFPSIQSAQDFIANQENHIRQS